MTGTAGSREPLEVTGRCPSCGQGTELMVAGDGRPVICPRCGQEVLVQLGDVFFEKGALDRCILCGERHLYRQKDFNQRVGCFILALGSGVGLVLAGLYGAIWLWAVLLVTAALDGLLYRIVPDVVICYRCKAHYRNLADSDAVAPFDLQLADAIEGRMGGGLQPPAGAADEGRNDS